MPTPETDSVDGGRGHGAINGHWTRQLIPLAVLVLVAAVVLAAPIQALRWYQAPFVGALFEPNHVVSRITGAGWAARAAGVEWPDRLVAIDGQPLAATEDLTRRLDAAGQTVQLTFERRADLSRYSIVVPAVRPTFQDFASLFLIPYLVGLVFLGLGIWVYTLRWRLRAGRAYLFFCCAAAVVAAAFLDMNSTHVLVRLWVAAVPVAGLALAQLAVVFPTDVPWVRRWPNLRHFLWLPCGLVIAWAQWQLYNLADPWAYLGSWLLNYSLVTLSLLVFVVLMAQRLRRSDSPMVRQQSRVMVLGGLLAFGPVVVLYLLPTLLQPAAPARFVAILYFPALVVFPLAVAYSIVRYRMPELDQWLSRQVAYGLMTVVVVVLYFGLVAAVGALLGGQVAVNDPLVISLALFAMVAGFNPLRAGAQNLVDRLFFRQRADYRLALQDYSRELTVSTGLDQVLHRLLDRVALTLRPEQGLVYLYDEAAGHFAAYGPAGRVTPAPTFAAEGEVASRLRADTEPWHLPPDSRDQAGLMREMEVLSRMRLEVLAPLRTDAGLSGWLALGPKRSGQPYTGDDLAFLGGLASQSALAVENVRLFVNLQRNYLETVQVKNLLGNIFASIASAVITTDADDQVTHCNAAAQQLLGLTEAGVLGRPYQTALPGKLDGLERLVSQAQSANQSVVGREIMADVPGRGRLTLLVSVSPLKDASGLTIGMTIVLDDLTEQRHLEADRERIRQTFGRVVAPRVRDRLLSGPASLNLAGTRQTITTLFADVRGFTTLSEHMRPEELFALLNEHLTLAAQAVLDHEGTIDKFLGDAIMALFNVPDPQPDHTLRAVKAALDMQARLKAHRLANPARLEVHFGAAITVGDAIVGNVGTPELFNYTAVGDTVNLAKRLQESAEPGQILLNAAAYERVRSLTRCRPLEPVQVKGRAAFEQIYEVLGLLEEPSPEPMAQGAP